MQFRQKAAEYVDFYINFPFPFFVLSSLGEGALHSVLQLILETVAKRAVTTELHHTAHLIVNLTHILHISHERKMAPRLSLQGRSQLEQFSMPPQDFDEQI